MEVVSAPFEIRNADVEVRGPAPDVGQHTREVLQEIGLEDAELERLLQEGVISLSFAKTIPGS